MSRPRARPCAPAASKRVAQESRAQAGKLVAGHKQLAYNFYPAGSWEVCTVGYLPRSSGGELEDVASARFVGPGGDVIGQSVQVDQPTEMAVQLSVEAAENNLSPTVFGVRVERAS